jgi:hypothetical protein
MKVIVNRSRIIDGKLYKMDKAAVDMPDMVKKDWFFQACVKEGDISLVGDSHLAVAPSRAEVIKPVSK